MNYYTEPFKKYAAFSGRATRKEFWMFVLFNFLIILAIRIISYFINIAINFPLINDLVYVYYLAVIIPIAAVLVRRLHDINRGAWWLLLCLPLIIEDSNRINNIYMTIIDVVTPIALVILIVLCAMDSQPGDNKYGPNLKGVGTSQSAQENKSKVGWVFGGLSFIPLIGVLFGIIAIVFGATKKTKGQIFLGIAGILFSVILYGGLFYFGLIAKTGPWANLRIQLTSQIINTDAGQISLYKNEHGTLPTKLSDLGTPSPTNLFYIEDPWGTEILYTPKNNGAFELRSAGPDKIMNTNDDVSQSF